MMLKLRSTALTLALAGAALSPAMASNDCPEAGDAPRPDWVTTPTPVPGFYAGVGVTERGALTLDQQRSMARQAALNDLVSGVEVHVRSELRLEETAGGGGDDLRSDVDFRAVTESTASALLPNVTVRDTWLDPKTCALWLRAIAPEAAVREQQRIQATRASAILLRDLVDAAADSTAELRVRERSLARARELLQRIDFSLVDDGTTAQLWRDEIERAATQLAADQTSGAQLEDRYAAAMSLLESVKNAPDGAARIRAHVGARNALQSIAAAQSFAAGPEFWPEKALWGLAAIERELGHACEAEQALQQIATKSAQTAWGARADAQLADLKCDDEARAAATWRSFVYGRDALVLCIQKTDGRTGIWDRACSELRSALRKHGALSIDIRSGPASAAAYQQARSCVDAQRCDAGQDRVLAVSLADGNLSTRENARAPSGRDYQFRGDLGTAIAVGDRVAYADAYSGVGGWNPVSAEMAMEVVALQAMKRMDQRIAKSWPD